MGLFTSVYLSLLNRIITVTLGTIVDFDIVAFAVPLVDLLASSPVVWSVGHF
jgi:hypothetical protein